MGGGGGGGVLQPYLIIIQSLMIQDLIDLIIKSIHESVQYSEGQKCAE